MVLDFGKYFLGNFSTTSSHVLKIFPLKECIHFFVSLDNENENKLSRMEFFETLVNLTMLHISM